MTNRSLTTLILLRAVCTLLSLFPGQARGATASRPVDDFGNFSTTSSIHLISLTSTVSSKGESIGGGSIVQSLPVGDYQNTLSTVFSAIQGALLSKLSKQPLASAPNVELRTVGVGVGLSGSIGLGPIFQISLSPKLVLVFSNSKNPVYPD